MEMRGKMPALLFATAFFLCAEIGQSNAQAPAGPTQGDLILRAAEAASHTDPAKWDWPVAASDDVRKSIIAGNYSTEELRNIFITLARSSGDRWPNDGTKAARPSMESLNAPGFVMTTRGFHELEAFYGSNGYGGISDRINKVDLVLAHGDRVFVSWIIEGHHTGTLFGFPGDGKLMDVRESSITRFTDGKVVDINFIADDFALYTQAGGKVSFPDKPDKP
jgi:predicted ester cyclase